VLSGAVLGGRGRTYRLVQHPASEMSMRAVVDKGAALDPRADEALVHCARSVTSGPSLLRGTWFS